MKRLAIALLALFSLSSAAFAQTLPEAPAPAPDPAWAHLRNLTSGQPIIVTVTDGRSVHCIFASVTDAYLFCNPAGNPPGVGFRFDQADVLAVDFDLPSRQAAQFRPHEHNYHPAWISSMIAGGFIVGLATTRSADAGTSARAGLIGAVVVGAIGAPIAFLPHPLMASQPAFPAYAFGARLRFPTYARIRK
jgi:hypothetical protein